MRAAVQSDNNRGIRGLGGLLMKLRDFINAL